LIGGLTATDADEFLRGVPIVDANLREAIIDGARETSTADAPVYPLMLDLQVEHWRACVARNEPIMAQTFCVDAPDIDDRHNKMVERMLRDYRDANLQATLRRLACARRFDRPAFEHIVGTFHTGLEYDAFNAIATLSIATQRSDGYVVLHGVVAEAICAQLDPIARRETRQALFQHFSVRARVPSPLGVTDAAMTALIEAAHLLRQLDIEHYVTWLAAAVKPFDAAARYEQVARVWREALEAVEKELGSEHPDTARCLTNLGLVLRAQGDYSGAQPLLERALAISENLFGELHPNTAAAVNNMASLMQDRGALAEARPLFERAYTTHEALFGLAHPTTGLSANNLGLVLRAGARALLQQALAIREATPDCDEADVAASISNLALVFVAEGRLEAAQPLAQRALQIDEKHFGPMHPTTAGCLNMMGYILHARGKLDAAWPFLRRSLTIYEEALGPEHPETVNAQNNLASLLQARGDPAGAVPLFERVLSIREAALGPLHPQTALSLNNLASSLLEQGLLDKARPLFERALAIREVKLGPEHPDTPSASAISRSCYATKGMFAMQDRCCNAHCVSARRLLGGITPQRRSFAKIAARWDAEHRFRSTAFP
jgi:tetratricopeptide (TPR) repeat protein